MPETSAKIKSYKYFIIYQKYKIKTKEKSKILLGQSSKWDQH